MEAHRKDPSQSNGPGILGRGAAAWAVAVVVVAAALAIVAWIALVPADEPTEAAALRPPRQQKQPEAPGRRGPAALVRKGVAADSKRQAAVRPTAAAAGERGEAGVEQALPEEEEVIENVPGKEYPPDVDAAQYIQRLRDMGETEGIAAFPPPGTDPPKVGVVVPDDYAVPEGYERYYQYTDDGKPLEPILLFSPEYEFFDDEGNQIPVPEDRVVPPDQVPSGLPVQMLDPESPRDPGGLIQRSP